MRKSDHVSFSKYEFSEEECPLRIDPETGRLTGKADLLYVNSGLCDESIPGTKLIDTIKRIDNSTAFHILQVD